MDIIENTKKQLSVFKRITFVENTHSYLIDNEPAAELSVTKTIKQFKKPFEVDKNAARIAAKTGATVLQIKEEWERNRDYSATLGTILHKYIECFYTKQPFDIKELNVTLGFDEKTKLKDNLPTLIQQFDCFYEENKHLLNIKNELVVGDLEDTKICGMLDMLAYNTKTQELEILDFKTNKKMQRVTPFGKLFYPFERFTEGELNEYTIQLNVYKYFVEKYTNLKIEKLKVVWFNNQNLKYQIFELEGLQEEIKLMIDRIKANSLFQEESLL